MGKTSSAKRGIFLYAFGFFYPSRAKTAANVVNGMEGVGAVKRWRPGEVRGSGLLIFAF